MPETGGKTLLLKTAHKSHRTWRKQAGTDFEALPNRLAFMLLEGSMHHSGEEN